MKKLLSILCIILLVFSMTGCGAEQKELTNVAVYEDYQLELTSAEKFTTDEGKLCMRVKGVYTNNSADPEYGLACFAVRAFQNDTELTECTDINGEDSSLTVEVKNGASVDVSYAFELAEDSEVEVLIGTPTADQDTIGKAVYFKAEE